MAKLTPTRVSLYDFLTIDTLPIDSIVADSGRMSLPQARIIIESSIQATICALLAYQQNFDGSTILKKLLTRSQVKELRHYNAFNLKTMQIAMQYGQPLLNTLYKNSDTLHTAYEKLAEQSHTSSKQVRPLLAALTLIYLREIAILTDYAYLDGQEIDEWFKLQPQFLRLEKRQADPLFITNPVTTNTADETTTTQQASSATPILDRTEYIVSSFDLTWCDIVGYQIPQQKQKYQSEETLPQYAKVIGRVSDNKNTANSSQPSPTDDILEFDSLSQISLPYQRWLLKLAKIADIYLSRNRLHITSEPEKPPSRPLISKHLLGNAPETPKTASEQPIEYDTPPPFWKNPVILLIVAVIGGLSILAVIKYQYKERHTTKITVPSTSQQEPIIHDIAIVRVDDEESKDKDANESSEKQH
ncbi:hypothetical protein [Psychrobacter sp. I-STPA6b]|uniref:hypothetical protein n=1 Tax=Psychrobacter sp. I-STPA6b TaxID=2585718 RepID=UPI001D0C9324|nr:hypothetical protein [Psychrobacter sp. I-STPA6b]